ncbi:helix-turn-helix domain-containing protein [Polaribacter sp.]|uniref:helix-turn-helix domain-containing protein n=1 Tax=Polaribacter sp. TaxID=1920175 RepID=UPI003F6C1FF5
MALPIFLLLIIIRISFVSFYSDNDSIEVTYLFEKYTTFEEIFSLVVSLTTFGYSFHIVSKRQDLFSQILSYDNLKWVYSFFKLGVSIYIFWIVALAFTVVLDFKDFIYSYYPLRVLTTVLIYWAGYQSILQLRLLKERKNLRKKLNLQSVTTQTFDTNTSDNSEYLDALFAKLEKLLESTRLFTQPKINLELLANELDVSSNKLSSCIKKNTSNNFNDFINGYRVHLAKELLVDNDYKQYTITSIGLESGFNSKSSFYYTFKKYTGITPAAYQKSIKL